MEAQDFEMPSPKRQRTNSPNAPHTATSINDSDPTTAASAPSQTMTEAPQQSSIDTDMLDLLMQHVEAEAGSGAASQAKEHDVPIESIADHNNADHLMNIEQTSIAAADIQAAPAVSLSDQQSKTATATSNGPETLDLPPGLEALDPAIIAQVREAAAAADLPPTAETILQEQVPEPNTDPLAQGEQQREWETDSSPYDSSDDSSDTSSDSDSESEAGDDYTLLDPLEQARILMAEDGGAGADSDDEGGAKTARSAGNNLRTQNEQAEAVPPKPDIVVTENMHIEELGNIEAIVENNVLIRAKISGSYQVLESGSVLCLENRKVVGAIAETLGRVEEPLYTMRFANQEDIVESGISERGTKVFYVKDHSSFVFTQPLQAVKGSDASNLHDEEVGADEMEFSDDEAEAEYKRMMKAKRKGIDPSTASDRGRNSRGRGRGRGGSYQHHSQSNSHSNDPMEINYDDVEEGETDYTPLRRPDTLGHNSGPPPSRGGNNQRGRGRGNRGRGRGGNHNNRFDGSALPNANSMYSQPQGQYYPVQQPPQQSYFGHQMPPPPPQITPGGGYMGNSIPPSPMTPLPGAASNYNFNFATAAQNQWQQYHQNQNTQYQQQFNGQINAEALAQVQRQLEQMRQQAGQNGWPPQQ